MLEIEEFPKVPGARVKESVILDAAVERQSTPLCLSGFDGRDSSNSEKYSCNFFGGGPWTQESVFTNV